MSIVKNLSIKQKLILIILTTSLLTLTLFSAAFIYNDLKMFKDKMVRDLTVLAGTIGSSSRASLVFKDSSSAERNLSSLKENDQIEYAALYDANNRILAAYSRDDAPKKLLPHLWEEGHVFTDDRLEIMKDLRMEDNFIGRIHLHSSMEDYDQQVQTYIFVVALIFSATLACSILLAFKLQLIISKPILSLADIAREISTRNDYSIRGKYDSKDELGVLFSGFNEMLEHIEKREQELEEYKDILEKNNERLRDFTHTASHDLQEPLRKIIIFGDRLNEQCQKELNDRGKLYLEKMQNAALRMSQLLEDLRKYSLVTEKKAVFESVDLKAVLADVMLDLEIEIQKQDGSIEIGELPTIEAIQFQMRTLFQNLISNSLKYRKTDEPPKVSIWSRNLENGLWEIMVEDNGIGFDPKYIDRVFKPFERLHGENKVSGTGMGLTLCQKIVSQHNGEVSVVGMLGKGVVSIKLPARQ